jgi:ATP-dependent DNA helicase RecQ
MPDVRFVVHWGACDSALQYWQEVGRAGRDGNKAKAYMYATKSSIVHINDDMKNICNGVTWLFNVAFATTRNHAIQDSFSKA